MKREIKFRAWIPNTGWLAEGFSIAMDGTEWYDDDGHSWPISDLEIMQFTGLKDKNGKDIYEGDIIKRYHLTGMVIYDTKRATFIMMDGFNESLSNEIYGVEVIGNIYENAELLNK